MNLLFISHRLPYPPNKGDKIRSFNILKYLSKDFDIHLACIIDDENDVEKVNGLKPYVKELCFDLIHPALKKLRSATEIFRKKPISSGYFYSKRLQVFIDKWMDEVKINNVFCFSSPTAEYIFRSRHYKGAFGRAQKVMDLIDVDSEKWAQYAEKARFPMSLIYRIEASLLLLYEQRVAKEFNHLLLVSDAERKLFENKTKVKSAKTIANGVDLNYFAPNTKDDRLNGPPKIIFTGAMDYWPNIDAVSWFVKDVFPDIKKVFGDAEFYIVGGHPTKEVSSLGRERDVFVTGYVDDIRRYIAMADVCVIPLRVARGIQNKVLEALAMGKSVVTTPQGLEGINAVPERDLLLASDSSIFSDKVNQLLADPLRAKEIGFNARRCAENGYSWQKNLNALDELFL